MQVTQQKSFTYRLRTRREKTVPTMTLARACVQVVGCRTNTRATQYGCGVQEAIARHGPRRYLTVQILSP
jgi:hypothetical protein